MVVCGKDFTGEMISRIQAKVNAEPDLSRRQLSRQVCEWLDWRKADGGWKEGSCRKALARLNRKKVLVLPERRRICTDQAGPAPQKVNVAEVTARLGELGEVRVSPVLSRHSPDSKIARALLQGYHPLGAGASRGAQMRYLVRSSRFGPLGVLTFSSGAWALKKRDQHIGWSEAARRQNLQYVVSNDRFLILPTVHVENLASHVLALVMRRLADDWE